MASKDGKLALNAFHENIILLMLRKNALKKKSGRRKKYFPKRTMFKWHILQKNIPEFRLKSQDEIRTAC